MRLFLQLWRLLDTGQRRAFLLAQALALVMAGFTFAGVAAVVPFFAVLADRQLITRNPPLAWLYQHLGFAGEHGFILALAVAVLGIVLLGSVVNLVGSLLLNRFAYRTGQQFCVALFDEYLHRDLRFHLAANSATLFNNVVWEVSRGTTGLLQSYLALVTNIATSVLIIASILAVHPLIAVTVAAALCGSYGAVYVLARQRLLRNGLLESHHTEERTRIANEAFGAMREILLLNVQGFFRQKFAASCAAIARAALNTNAVAQSPRHILDCIVAGTLVAGAVLSIGDGGSAAAWLAQLTFLGFAAYRLLPALQQVFHGVVKIRGERAAFTRIAADLGAARRAAGRPVRSARAPAWRGRPFATIELRGVEFRYAADRPPAIEVPQLTIAAGTTSAFVGASGSGKTTLAELILGLLPPGAGTVAVDGTVLTAGNRADWQSTVAYVPQQVFLFDASLAENVALATELEQIDMARLREALRLARLDELIATLPRGHLEVLGEHGMRLSGGQRQRVGLARALYRRASLLVLDEPTSALDGLTEREVMETIATLRGVCTIILIAHRAAAVRRCDRIFELAGGKVVGAGSYAQLAHQSGRFERLLHGGDAPRALNEPGAAVHRD
ncbi:MAG: ABC transporter ATP-binding protein [Gammaproteobacteria bacterium]|nr:ABC transporter ATP-binding protein [Gammaproteobacteria bacterium]